MKKSAKRARRKPTGVRRGMHAAPEGMWNLRLYIAGQSPKSIAAMTNLRRICEEYMPGKYKIEVVDLIRHPQLAAGDQILAIPTLVRKLPEPVRKIVGDLSNTERALVGLQLRPWKPEDHATTQEHASFDVKTRAV